MLNKLKCWLGLHKDVEAMGLFNDTFIRCKHCFRIKNEAPKKMVHVTTKVVHLDESSEPKMDDQKPNEYVRLIKTMRFPGPSKKEEK